MRGAAISSDTKSISSEIARLEKAGIREITLLGQNVNSYRFPSDLQANGQTAAHLSFPELLLRLCRGMDRIEWIRFLSSHPKDLSLQLIEVIAGESRLCRHIHLPVQHASDRVLEQMARGYTRGRYLELVKEIRDRLPGVSLTTDILIGFPGEREEDFHQLLDFMEEVRFNDAYMYRYNPREGTRAFSMGDDVPDAVKVKRLSRVIDLQRAITRGYKLERVGRRFRVLVEAVSKKNENELLGRSEHNEPVVFAGPVERIGHFTRVEITSIEGSTLRGKEIL